MMRTILVVDDNLASLKVVQAQLTGLYRILPAKSGAQALTICTKQRPDLVLLDIEMPEMDGFETLRRLKLDPTFDDIPVIFLTSHSDPVIEVRALSSGASDFIVKPPEMVVLIHRIELHLKLYDLTHPE